MYQFDVDFQPYQVRVFYTSIAWQLPFVATEICLFLPKRSHDVYNNVSKCVLQY